MSQQNYGKSCKPQFRIYKLVLLVQETDSELCMYAAAYPGTHVQV